MKTSELLGPALDWAVAKCVDDHYVWWSAEGRPFERTREEVDPRFEPSTNWSQGGPIIEREGIGFFCNRTAEIGARFSPDAGADWRAFALNKHAEHHFGPTPLIAAMRCYVASKLGDEVEIPGELS